MTRKPFVVRQHVQVTIATLGRPEACNTWGQGFHGGIAECFPRWADDKRVRAIVVKGNEQGRTVSAGANLKDASANPDALL